MTNSALAIIEEVYEITLNPDQPYFAQLKPLAPNGELANRISSNKVLFRLCELIDSQAKEIKALKDDRQQIAEKMIDLENKLSFSFTTTETTNSKPDVTTTDPTQPITNPVV